MFVRAIVHVFGLTLGLICLAVSVLFCAQTLGLIPNRYLDRVQGRTALCEAIAINSSIHASRNDLGRIEASLKAVVQRNRQIQWAGVRRSDGQLLVEIGEHATQWSAPSGGRSTDSAITVPITANGQVWGSVEIRFQPLTQGGISSFLLHPSMQLIAFVSLLSLPVYFVYLRRMLQHLDPSRVIPDRVRAAFDTLTGGLLVLDKEERIVLANKAFASNFGMAPFR